MIQGRITFEEVTELIRIHTKDFKRIVLVTTLQPKTIHTAAATTARQAILVRALEAILASLALRSNVERNCFCQT